MINQIKIRIVLYILLKKKRSPVVDRTNGLKIPVTDCYTNSLAQNLEQIIKALVVVQLKIGQFLDSCTLSVKDTAEPAAIMGKRVWVGLVASGVRRYLSEFGPSHRLNGSRHRKLQHLRNPGASCI